MRAWSRTGWCLAAAGWASMAAAAVDIDAYLDRMPPETYQEQIAGAEALTADPHAWASALAERLRPAGDEDDTAVRFALDGWTASVLRPEAAPGDREAVAAALAAALPAVSEAEAQAFLIGQLSKLGVEASLPALVPYLSDPDLASHAAMAIRSIGRGSVPDLARVEARRALPGSADAHRAVLRSLLGPATRAGNPPAAPAEWTPPAFQVCAALSAMVDAEGDEAIPRLVDALNDPDLEVRAHAGRLLESRMTPATAADAFQTIEARAAEQRADALRRWARTDPDGALAAARQRLEDGQPAVRTAALETFARCAGPTYAGELIDRLIEAGEADRDVLREALVQRTGLGLNAVAASRLNDERPAARATALAFLRERGAREQSGPVFTAVLDPDPEVAGQAVQTLRAIAGPEDGGRLLELLADEALPEPLRDGLVPALVGALGELPTPEARMAPIQQAWPEAAGPYRRFLQAALPGLDAPAGLAMLAADAEHPDPAAREGAVRALCRWNGPEAVPPLMQTAAAQEDLRLHRLTVDRCLQLLAQQADRAADREDADALRKIRRHYEDLLTAARTDPDRTRIGEALQALPDPHPEQAPPPSP